MKCSDNKKKIIRHLWQLQGCKKSVQSGPSVPPSSYDLLKLVSNLMGALTLLIEQLSWSVSHIFSDLFRS